MIIYMCIIPSTFDAVDEQVRKITHQLRSKWDICDNSILFKISFMLREVLNNAVEHGNQFSDDLYIYHKVEYIDNRLIFTVKDEGAGIVVEPSTNEDELTKRTRGLATIVDFDFEIEIIGSEMKITYVLDGGAA